MGLVSTCSPKVGLMYFSRSFSKSCLTTPLVAPKTHPPRSTETSATENVLTELSAQELQTPDFVADRTWNHFRCEHISRLLNFATRTWIAQSVQRQGKGLGDKRLVVLLCRMRALTSSSLPFCYSQMARSVYCHPLYLPLFPSTWPGVK
jgi:hypothetical protein